MRQLLSLTLALGLLGGCSTFTKPADTVTFQRGQAFKVYSDLRVSYAVTRFRLTTACANGMLELDLCQREFPRIDEEMQRLDRQIMEALANPATEVNWETVGEAVKIIIKIAALL